MREWYTGIIIKMLCIICIIHLCFFLRPLPFSLSDFKSQVEMFHYRWWYCNCLSVCLGYSLWKEEPPNFKNLPLFSTYNNRKYSEKSYSFKKDDEFCHFTISLMIFMEFHVRFVPLIFTCIYQ